jgi:hypothetical protein
MNINFVFGVLMALAVTRCNSSGTVQGITYYLDAENGNDHNSGTSASEPWESLEKLNAIKLGPYDRLLLKSGQVFTGTLLIRHACGNVQAPVTISSWDGGLATIRSDDGAAFIAEECSHLIIKRIKVIGSDRLGENKTDGIVFFHVEHGVLDSIEASGYLKSGIHVIGGGHIRISHAYVHENGFAGIFAESGESSYGVDGSGFKTLKDLYIGYSIAENNPGCPIIKDNHSGNGILIAGVTGGTIEYCEAMNNGWDMPREGNGPVGIWAYMSDSVIIQHCYAHHNKTSPKGKDGGGFDFDGGVRHSVMQYNLSAFNEGAGYGIFQYAGATQWTDNIMRYNISYHDGSKNSQAGIFMWCDPAAMHMGDFHAFNNTIVNKYGMGANFEPGNYENFFFENNIFLITRITDGFIGGKFSGAIFDRNLYWSAGNYYNKKSQPGVNIDHSALIADPKLLLPENDTLPALAPARLSGISYFRLQEGSPCLGAGKSLYRSGILDFWNNGITGSRNPNLGADQGQ